MFNHPQFWWFLSRASGIVAWALLTGSVLWGILLATRVLKAIDRRCVNVRLIFGGAHFVHRNRHSDQSSLCNEFIKNNIKKGS
ncbi:MAG: hypothetical protein EBV40_05220 [Actinobacteria bacterium]|nr:hypothetical protein [Actinomycetota bacterium]